MIDLPSGQLLLVKKILSERVPRCEVRAFGSRITRNAKAWSDLDLAVVGSEKLDAHLLYDLREAFEESDLPVRVDVLDWYAISPEFQAVIGEKYEVIQSGAF